MAYARFFAWLNAFVAGMLLPPRPLADNFILLFFGWGGGPELCSWGLIGFWWHAGSESERGAQSLPREPHRRRRGSSSVSRSCTGGSAAPGDRTPSTSPISNARFSSVAVGTDVADSVVRRRRGRGPRARPPVRAPERGRRTTRRKRKTSAWPRCSLRRRRRRAPHADELLRRRGLHGRRADAAPDRARPALARAVLPLSCERGHPLVPDPAGGRDRRLPRHPRPLRGRARDRPRLVRSDGDLPKPARSARDPRRARPLAGARGAPRSAPCLRPE